MCAAPEQDRREDDARGSIAGECDELALEITAEESVRQEQPCGAFVPQIPLSEWIR
jgi:hypothetical protein